MARDLRKYIIQFDTIMPGTIAWEYSFEMASDAMAIEYARNIAKNDPAAVNAILVLWTTETDVEDAMLARFEKSPVQVLNTHRRKEMAR
jgi:hypothetical protein